MNLSCTLNLLFFKSTTTKTLIGCYLASWDLISRDILERVSKGLGMLCYTVGRHTVDAGGIGSPFWMREVHVLLDLDEQ